MTDTTTTTRSTTGSTTQSDIRSSGAPSPSLEAVIDTYLAAYSEPDAARRGELVAEVFAADGALVDPPIDATGRAAIADMMGAVLGHYPGHRFTRTSGVDVHHNVARYGWELVDTSGVTALTGIDIADVEEDGMVRRIVGFLGDLPPRT